MPKPEYEVAIDNFKVYQETLETDGKKPSACDQLDKLRETIVQLNQIKNTYFSRPCLRDWPCPFTQHRSAIDALKETQDPIIKSLIRRCETETFLENISGLKGSGSQSQTSINNNLNGSGTVMNHPTFNLSKPTV